MFRLRYEPPTALRSRMIDLGTLASLHEHRHRLDAYCPRCNRWRKLPLAELVAQGHGARRLPLYVRCRDCGEVARLQVRAPAPTRGSGGRMKPRSEAGDALEAPCASPAAYQRVLLRLV